MSRYGSRLAVFIKLAYPCSHKQRTYKCGSSANNVNGSSACEIVEAYTFEPACTQTDFTGKILLIGCGGVGRMMAIEAALAGADLYIAVLESDMPLAKQVEKEIKAMKSDARITIVLNTEIPTDVHYELLMNACPVGMYPKTNACPVPDEVIKASGAVFDVIYNPRETLLMQKAKAMGKNAVGGMAMLVWQAVSAHEIWDGDEYTDEEVQSIIDEMEIAVEKDFK